MSVEKRGDKWTVRWREHGRNRRETFTLKKDALVFDANRKRAKALGEDLVRDDRTLDDYAEYWRRHRTVAESTAAMYDHQLLERVLPWLGHLPVRVIDPPTVKDWIAQLRREKAGDPSILKATTVLSAILREAVEDGLLSANPVRQVRKPAQRRARQPVMVAPARVEAIRQHILSRRGATHAARDATLVSVLAYAGPRPESEALPLQWQQVGKRNLTLRATKGRGDVKPRQVRLLRALAQDLREWRMRTGNPATGLVFPNPDGNPWTGGQWDNWRERVFDPAAKHAGLPPSTRPRDLRSSFASLLIAEGWSIIAVADQLGHSARTLLKDYAGLFAEFDPSERVDADSQIAALRAEHVPATYPRAVSGGETK